MTATGNHAQRTAQLLGIKIPAIPVEHQFIVTEPDPALVDFRNAGNSEHPVLRDADAKWYVREERGGGFSGRMKEMPPHALNMASQIVFGLICFRWIWTGLRRNICQ